MTFRDFYNKREVEGSSTFLREKVLKMLKDYNVKAERYLDIGIGNGGFTKDMANLVKCREVHGIDVSEEAIHLALAKGIQAVNIDINEQHLPYPDDYFDFVTAIEVIEHLFNSDNLLSESYRILKQGGYFLVTSPNLASWLSIFSIILGYLPPSYEVSFRFRIGKPLGKKISLPLADIPIGHIKPYVPRALSEHVQAYGFEVLSLTGVRLIEGPGILKFIGLLDSVFSRIKRQASGIILIAKKSD